MGYYAERFSRIIVRRERQAFRISTGIGVSVQHAPLYSVPPKLLRAASLIIEDSTLPLRVPIATNDFLHRLGRQCDHSTKPLGRFLLLVSSSRLSEEIIRILLPREFQELRTETQRLQLEKQDAFANQEWHRAATLRDQTDLLKDQLRQMGRDVVIEVQPDHVLQAIANLGFNETIDLSGQEESQER